MNWGDWMGAAMCVACLALIAGLFYRLYRESGRCDEACEYRRLVVCHHGDPPLAICADADGGYVVRPIASWP